MKTRFKKFNGSGLTKMQMFNGGGKTKNAEDDEVRFILRRLNPYTKCQFGD